MIDSVRGMVESLEEQHVLLRVGSVVLRLLVPGYFLRRLSPGESVEFPVYFHLQMEGNRAVPLLVAFPDRSDRQFFESFISVSGVGVRAAVKALARPVLEIASAIAAGDTDLLRSLPGIGNARAKQIVARLQDEGPSTRPDRCSCSSGYPPSKPVSFSGKSQRNSMRVQPLPTWSEGS